MLGTGQFKTNKSKPVKLDINLPSYFVPISPAWLQARRKIKPSRFCKNALDSISVHELKNGSTCDELSAKNRNAIISLVSEAELNPKIYFDRTELSILLHMFIQLTGLELRGMYTDEMKAFLYSTLDITNPYALDGLCRAATMQSKHTAGQRKNVSPLDFLQTLSILLRGTITDRAELAFHVMDIDSDGLLRKTVEFRRLLHDTFDITLAAQNPEIDPEEPVRDTINYLCEKLQCTMAQPITLNKFKAIAADEPWIIESLLPCIPSEFTNIVFQSLFTTNVQLPSLENPPRLSKSNL